MKGCKTYKKIKTIKFSMETYTEMIIMFCETNLLIENKNCTKKNKNGTLLMVNRVLCKSC